MNPVQHVRVKIFAHESVDLEPAIPVFHRWIQEKACPEMLIDVADYRHVPNGPGVMLIGHEAHYSLDNTKGRLGLLYNRRLAGGEAVENLKQAYGAAVAACKRLEADPTFTGKLQFNTRECEISINDRALAPNTEATLEAVRPDFERFCASVWGPRAFTIQRLGEPRELFTVSVKPNA